LVYFAKENLPTQYQNAWISSKFSMATVGLNCWSWADQNLSCLETDKLVHTGRWVCMYVGIYTAWYAHR
jgi:hypothetical protein